MICLQCKEEINGGYYTFQGDPKIPYGRFINGEPVLFKKDDIICEKCWLFPRWKQKK